jgi:hypothetical protein
MLFVHLSAFPVPEALTVTVTGTGTGTDYFFLFNCTALFFSVRSSF